MPCFDKVFHKKNFFGEANNSLLDMAYDGLVSFASDIIGQIIKFKIPHVTSMSGSFKAVSKQIFTKFHVGLIRKISTKSFGKILIYNLVENIIQTETKNLIYILKYYNDKLEDDEKDY